MYGCPGRVMGSLPKDKAGVGSAVNDTTRQIGGALGVAILGSILSSGYADRLAGQLNEQAPGRAVPEAALDGIGGALAVADRMPTQAGTALAGSAPEAFISAMDVAVSVGAVAAALGAVLTVLLLRPRLAKPAGPERVREAELDLVERVGPEGTRQPVPVPILQGA